MRFMTTTSIKSVIQLFIFVAILTVASCSWAVLENREPSVLEILPHENPQVVDQTHSVIAGKNQVLEDEGKVALSVETDTQTGEKTYFNQDGTVAFIENKNGELIASFEYEKDENGQILKRVQKDRRGYLTASWEYGPDGILQKVVEKVTVDQQVEIAAGYWVTQQQEKWRTHTFNYQRDKEGNLIEKIEFIKEEGINGGSYFSTQITTRYSSSGVILWHVYEDSDGNKRIEGLPEDELVVKGDRELPGLDGAIVDYEALVNGEGRITGTKIVRWEGIQYGFEKRYRWNGKEREWQPYNVFTPVEASGVLVERHYNLKGELSSFSTIQGNIPNHPPKGNKPQRVFDPEGRLKEEIDIKKGKKYVYEYRLNTDRPLIIRREIELDSNGEVVEVDGEPKALREQGFDLKTRGLVWERERINSDKENRWGPMYTVEVLVKAPSAAAGKKSISNPSSGMKEEMAPESLVDPMTKGLKPLAVNSLKEGMVYLTPDGSRHIREGNKILSRKEDGTEIILEPRRNSLGQLTWEKTNENPPEKISSESQSKPPSDKTETKSPKELTPYRYQPREIRSLIQDLDDDDPNKVKEAKRKLVQIGEPAVKELIQALQDSQQSPAVRENIVLILGDIGSLQAVKPLISILQNNKEDRFLRSFAASTLGNDLADEEAVASLMSALGDAEEIVRLGAVEGLRHYLADQIFEGVPADTLMEPFLALLDDPDP